MGRDAQTELVDAVNDALETLRADGTYDEIYDSYFAIDEG